MGISEALGNTTSEELDFLLKNGKRSSVLDGFDFESLIYCSWKFLKETLPDLINLGNFEKLIVLLFADRGQYRFSSDIDNIQVSDLIKFVLWITDEVKGIAEMERDFLKSEPDADLNAAGINELEVFGNMNTIDGLAGGDVLKYAAVKALPYNVIFDKQLKTIKENAIQKKLIKIKEDKAKHKK